MANNLEVDEGSSGKDLRTEEVSADVHEPVHRLSTILLPTSGEYGEKTVSSAGTPEALVGSSTTIKETVTIQALEGNGGDVYVGFDSTVSASNGFPLSASERITVAIDDIASIYLDVDTGGEGVRYIAT